MAAHVRTASRRWIAAAIGCHDGENTLADELEGSFTAGILNLADRGFFSMDRWIRFSARGAHLAWRVKNGAKSVPFKTIKTLPDGRNWEVTYTMTIVPSNLPQADIRPGS